MREQFQLCSKVVGLVLIVTGVVLSAGQLPRLAYGPDWQRYWGLAVPDLSSISPAANAVLDAQARPFAELGRMSRRDALLDLALQGILPTMLGFYLLRSENLVVRLAYPSTPRGASPAGSEPVAPPRGTPQAPERSADTDRKYAPPGLYDG